MRNSYNAKGELTNAGRVLSTAAIAGGVERKLQFQYDANGNRTRITHPDSFQADYGYDGLNRLTTVKENGTVTLATLSYDAQGRRLGLARGNGTSASYGHDGADRLTSLAEDMPGTASDQALTFAYTPSSQIRQNTRANEAYAWRHHSNGTRSYAVNGLNQYTAAGGVAPTYDAKGNLTSAGPATYAYSSENRLTSGAGTAFGYDPSGRLSSIGTSTRLLYDGPDLVAEYGASGTLQRRYVHGAGTDDPLVWYEGSGTSEKRWLHSDERGSIVAVTNAAGATLGINKYDEYGVPSPTNLGRFQYTGQTWLAEIGMYHYKARVYDPKLGRFLQVDPIGYDDQFNLYACVGGDPINKTDPTGAYGRGKGFSDKQWRKFDRAQKDAARRLDRSAATLRAALAGKPKDLQKATRNFERTFGKGSGTAANMAKAAGTMTEMAEALRDDGSGGHIANGLSAQDFANAGKSPAAMAMASIGGKTMSINLDHPAYGDFVKMRWSVGHESGHNKGLVHPTIGGIEPQALGSPSERAMFNSLKNRDPAAALLNPDSFMMYAIGSLPDD